MDRSWKLAATVYYIKCLFCHKSDCNISLRVKTRSRIQLFIDRRAIKNFQKAKKPNPTPQTSTAILPFNQAFNLHAMLILQCPIFYCHLYSLCILQPVWKLKYCNIRNACVASQHIFKDRVGIRNKLKSYKFSILTINRSFQEWTGLNICVCKTFY